MLGSLLDCVFIGCSNRDGKLPLQVEHYNFKDGKINTNWVCFMPEFCYRIPFIRKRLIPEDVNMDVYVLPKTSIQPIPEISRRFLDNVLYMAIQQQNRGYLGKEVNILGISLGNVLAFKFAEQFYVNKFISVVPGSRLAECIWESLATNRIANNSGREFREFQIKLADYNPIESVAKISPRYSEVYLGTSDVMIPYYRGQELAEAMRTRVRAKVHFNRFCGHVETILYFSKKFPRLVRAVSPS